MNPQDEIPAIKDAVEQILREYPAARNSDVSLVFLLSTKIRGVKISYLEFCHLAEVSFESIKRMRQKFQQEGKYLPTDPRIAKQRGRNAQAMREEMPKMEVD